MGATLTQRRRVKDEVLRDVNFFSMGRTLCAGNGIEVTVPWESAPANYVPAAAVRRRGQALPGITGRKGSAGGGISQV